MARRRYKSKYTRFWISYSNIYQDTHYKAVIIATGANAKWLDIPGEERLRGHGLSACATCDGFFFKGKDVAVIGGGDTAAEEALFLTKFATHVQLIHRRGELRASKIMQNRVQKHPQIDCIWHTQVLNILGEEKVTGLLLENLQTKDVSELAIDGVFIAIGHQPNTAIFQGLLSMDAQGYIIPTDHTMTSVPGIFAAGDVVDYRYRQAITAAADGCRAAIDAERWLTDQEI